MKQTGASFHSNRRILNQGFDWAMRQAGDCLVMDSPGGPCYEASLPGRNAYCMRDASHQALGAQILGAGACNRNIFTRFAEGISETKSFCSFWEIGFDGKPCPVDYTDDRDFWYNLPANFDVMNACFRMFNWTGDTGYFFDKSMNYFHHISTHDYIRMWDRDGDGIVDRRPGDGRRGIASYDESPRNKGYQIAADTFAAQYSALRVRAKMLRLRGETNAAAELNTQADTLQQIFDQEWWNEKEGHFSSVRFSSGEYGGEYIGMTAFMPLYFNIINNTEKQRKQLAYVVQQDQKHNQEERSYVPEILWRYGLDEAAIKIWTTMVSPDYKRREYPEISFAALEAIVSGYMGIKPDAARNTITTRSAVADNDFAEINYLPLWNGYIHLFHEAQKTSILENYSDRELTWVCRFADGAAKTQVVPAGKTQSLSRG